MSFDGCYWVHIDGLFSSILEILCTLDITCILLLHILPQLRYQFLLVLKHLSNYFELLLLLGYVIHHGDLCIFAHIYLLN
jgi:hypothetical protein